MNDRRDHPLDLILAFEELDGDDRTRAEAHLADCADCRDLLARCRDAERDASLNAAGLHSMEDGDPLAGCDAATRADADASRKALLRRFAAGSTSISWWRRGPGTGALLAVAAVLLAVVAVGPWLGGDDLAFESVRLAPAVVARDAATELAPGDPFSIRFTPLRDGWPVVVRVDANGVVLLCPTPDLAGWRLRADLPAVVPPPGAGVAWTLAEDAAAERWLLAMASDPVADPVGLAAELTSAGAADVRARLETRFGTVAELSLR